MNDTEYVKKKEIVNKKLVKRRENGLFAFAADLSFVLKSFQKEKVTIVDVKENWDSFCGENFISVCAPVSLRSGKLEVKAFYGPVALELATEKESIIEKINIFYGKEIIKDIKITQ